jgi:hypothetical protein
MEGYILKHSSSKNKMKHNAKTRVLVFSTDVGVRYGTLNSKNNSKKCILWDEILKCEQNVNSNCFTLTTFEGKQLCFECHSLEKANEWCKYININKTKEAIQTQSIFTVCDSESESNETIYTNDTVGMSNLTTKSGYTTTSSKTTTGSKFFSNILPLILTVSVIATSLVVEAQYYTNIGSSLLLQIGQ